MDTRGEVPAAHNTGIHDEYRLLSQQTSNSVGRSMIFPIFIAVLLVYFMPLLLIMIAVITTKNFHLRRQIVRVVAGMHDQFGRVRDLIATICVPILALFSIKLDRLAPFDLETMILAFSFLAAAVVSWVSSGICKAASSRLAEYGDEYPTTLVHFLDNYSRETLIYFSVMLGVSASPALSK
jgi:hypothetical protein